MSRSSRAKRASKQSGSGVPPLAQEPPIGEQIAGAEREDALRGLAIELVKRDLALSKRAIQYGPNDSGWNGNETLRAPLVKRIELLEELLDRAAGEPEETAEA